MARQNWYQKHKDYCCYKGASDRRCWYAAVDEDEADPSEDCAEDRCPLGQKSTPGVIP